MATDKAAKRVRAPRRAGLRKQLTIPNELAVIAVAFADERRTTDNDAVVQLALLGAQAYARERLIREGAEAGDRAVWAAMERSAGGESSDLTIAEAEALALAYRNRAE